MQDGHDDVESNPFQEDRLDDQETEGQPAKEEDKAEDEEREQGQNVPLGQPDSQYRRPSVSEEAIEIVDALKTSQGASSTYIVYCVRFQGKEVRRRYSDFLSLRNALASLHPCHIVPPIPPKNSLSSYAVAGAKPSKAKEDAALIARRRRMLTDFLNRLLNHRVLGQDRVFRKFLDPDTLWTEVTHSPPVTLAPKNPLRGPSSNPTDPNLQSLFASLPLPASNASLLNPDQRFLDSEAFTSKFSSHLGGSMEKVNRRLMKRWSDAASDWAEMGGGWNGLALRMGQDGSGLEEAIEKVGMAVDGGFTSTNSMLQAWEATFTEPLMTYTEFSSIIKGLLKFRHQKHAQYELTKDQIESKKATLEDLERSEAEAQRLEKALERARIATADPEPVNGQRQITSNGESEQAAPPTNTLTASTSSSSLGPIQRRSAGLLGAITHTISGMVDQDPEATRRSTISKTREQINQLDEALKALTTDLKYATTTIQSDLDRFQRQKVGDIGQMCADFADFHIGWARKNKALWVDALEAIDAIKD